MLYIDKDTAKVVEVIQYAYENSVEEINEFLDDDAYAFMPNNDGNIFIDIKDDNGHVESIILSPLFFLIKNKNQTGNTWQLIGKNLRINILNFSAAGGV